MLRERLRSLLGLRGNIPALALSEVIVNTGWSMFIVVWDPFVLSLGATVAILGSLAGVDMALRSGLLLVTGRISDSAGRKGLQVVSYILGTTGSILCVFAESWLLLIPTIILFAFSGALWLPANNAMVAESVEENKRGTAYSLMSLAVFIPGLYSSLLAGYLAQKYGLRTVLFIPLFTSISTLTIFQVFIKETLKKRRAVDLHLLISSLKKVFRPRFGLSKFYAAMIIDSFAYSVTGGIFFGMLVKSFGFTVLELGILSNILSITVAVTQIPMGKLVDRYGGKRMLLASRIIWLLPFISYLFIADFLGFLISRVFVGLALSAGNPSLNTYISKIVPEEERGRVFGDLNGLIGLASFPAPILGGFLYESYGFQAPILVTLLSLSVAIILLITVKER